jgi:predicted phosphodiesterase
MRVALISDIHANLEALSVVLERSQALSADAVVCLGDIVGYHADPNPCVELVRRHASRCLAGNHDQAAAGVIEPTHFGEAGRRAISWTREHTRPEHLDYLREMSVFERLDSDTCMVHGALHPEPNAIYHLSKPARVLASFEKLTTDHAGARVCFFGHTHRGVVYEYRNGQVAQLPIGNGAVVLRGDAHYLINPGSVGQPRDGDRRAAWALWDTETRQVAFQRSDYDWQTTQRKAQAAGLVYTPSLLEKSKNAVIDQLDSGYGLARRALRKSALWLTSAGRPGQP